MTVPSDPPASVTPAAFKTWAQNVSDTAQDHDSRVAALESATSDLSPGWPSGRYAYPPGTVITTAYSLTAASLRAVPIWSPGGAVNEIVLRVETTAGSTGALIRLGIYDNDGGNPGSLLLDGGTVDATSLGTKTATISTTLTRGWVWLAAVTQGSPTTAPSVQSIQYTAGTATNIGQANPGAVVATDALATGALPDPFGAVASVDFWAPRIGLRAA